MASNNLTMKQMSKTILFFGNERIATGVFTTAPTLQALIAAGYNVAAVIVAQDQAGASRKGRQLEIAEVAKQHGIPLLSPAKLKEAADDLSRFRAEAAVLVAYGKIVPQEIIDLFPKGIINIHPSLLPKHRGPTPLESVLLNGEQETGVSLMRLSAKMDAGPIYAQETVLLSGDESKQALSQQLLAIGAAMVIQYLPDILNGSLQPAEQSETQATYDQKITKAAAELDFQKPAEVLAREVRAYAGWPRSRAMIGTTEVIITKAHTEPTDGTPGTLWLDGKQLGIHAGNGVLIIDTLVPAGKKEMTASAFLAGYRAA